MEQIQEVIRLRGSLRMHLMDLEGNLLEEKIQDNTVVTVGRAFVLGQLESVNHITSQNFGYIAVGSGTTAPTTGDTGLRLEITRLAISAFATTGLTVNPPSWQAQILFATSDANTTIAEVGIFNSNSVGTMLARATIASFVKATSNTWAISYTISG
jgi:hypothetical protein